MKIHDGWFRASWEPLIEFNVVAGRIVAAMWRGTTPFLHWTSG